MCGDPDCRLGTACKGNVYEPKPDGSVRLSAPHHKNDRRPGLSSQPLVYSFPASSRAAALLRWHMRYGHKLLAWIVGGDTHKHLFVDEDGRDFDDDGENGPRFSLYWKGIIERVNARRHVTGLNPILHFPANHGRKVKGNSVMAGTLSGSMSMETASAVAVAMGTSVPTMAAKYAPGHRARMMQAGVLSQIGAGGPSQGRLMAGGSASGSGPGNHPAPTFASTAQRVRPLSAPTSSCPPSSLAVPRQQVGQGMGVGLAPSTIKNQGGGLPSTPLGTAARTGGGMVVTTPNTHMPPPPPPPTPVATQFSVPMQGHGGSVQVVKPEPSLVGHAVGAQMAPRPAGTFVSAMPGAQRVVFAPPAAAPASASNVASTMATRLVYVGQTPMYMTSGGGQVSGPPGFVLAGQRVVMVPQPGPRPVGPTVSPSAPPAPKPA